MLPPVATVARPTLGQIRDGYHWFMAADDTGRNDFIQSRLVLLGTKHGLHPDEVQPMRTSGSTGTAKSYEWGPGYVDLYKFFLNDLVRDGTSSRAVVSLCLATVGHDCDSALHVKETSNHAHVQRWIVATIKLGSRLPDMSGLLAGYDIIIAPSHYELIDRYSGLATQIHQSSLVLSTAEPISDYVIESTSTYGLQVRDWMRCWDGGASFYTCRYGGKHWVDYLSRLFIDDYGRLLSTDYFNLAQPFVDYHCGDYVASAEAGICRCGAVRHNMEFSNRQDMGYFIGPDGSPLTYRGLQRLVGLGCIDAGVTYETFFLSVCFGIGNRVIEITYVPYRRDNMAINAVVAAITARFHNVGFIDVKACEALMTTDRKVKRMYNLSPDV